MIFKQRDIAKKKKSSAKCSFSASEMIVHGKKLVEKIFKINFLLYFFFSHSKVEALGSNTLYKSLDFYMFYLTDRYFSDTMEKYFLNKHPVYFYVFG